MQKTLEIVTSALNEEDCIKELYRRLESVMELHPDYAWKIIFCDNGSTDKTWELISELSNNTNKVLGLRMSRTFSLDAAFTLGLDLTTADVVVLMASDLQDPPEVIHDFIRKYEEGYEQVVTKIVSRNQVPFVRRQMSTLFYFFANKATQNLIPRGVSDFRLLSRPVYLATRQMQERNRFLRGLIAWTGFKTAVIEIERQDRFAGDSKFVSIPLKKVVKWATNAILSHTSAPLTALSISGFLLSAFSFIGTVIAAILWFTGGVPFSGFGTLFALITVGFSLTMLALGVIAQYIALIYEEVKGRPVYIVAERTDEEKPF